jgi:hypothetical protein
MPSVQTLTWYARLTCLAAFCVWHAGLPGRACARDGELAQNRVHTTRAAPLGRPELRRPYAHPRYTVELEPHLLLQWAQVPGPRSDAGFGLGFRASIPVLANGPIPKLNNNLAVSFGADWSHFGGCAPNYYDCGAQDFWFPFVMQWNFFITEAWSVFPEVGLAVHHAVRYWEERGPRGGEVCGPGPDPYCDYSESRTRVAFATWLGTRFSLSDMFSFTLRVGTPSLVAGVSFRL